MPLDKSLINSLVVYLFTRQKAQLYVFVFLFVYVCLCYSKIQKYSPTESAKVYDKAVNRKSKVHFSPRQTLNYLKSDLANTALSYETKRNIVKQYLDVSIQHFQHFPLMECYEFVM